MLNINDKIEAKQKEIRNHEEEILKAQAYIEVLKDLEFGEKYESSRRKSKFPQRQKKTNIERAAEIIKEAGRPLHANEILVKMGKKRTLRNKVSIASSMAHYSNAGKIFKRVEPNTFDIITRH